MREHAGLRTTTRFYAARRVSLQCQVTANYVQETSPGSFAHGVPNCLCRAQNSSQAWRAPWWLMQVEVIFSISL